MSTLDCLLAAAQADQGKAEKAAEAGLDNRLADQAGVRRDHDFSHSDFLRTIAEIGAGER